MFHFTSFPHHRLFAAALGCLAAAALPLPAACGGAPTDGATAYTITDLGTLPGGTESVAGGLNASGQVAGGSGVLFSCAFLYSKGKMVDLTARLPAGSGWKLTKATGINDSGQICGSGTINDHIHAFLLTPK